MWHGSALYFTSDRLHGTMNLFRMDPTTGSVTALTEYSDYDVKYPSMGPRGIIFQNAEALHFLDLATGETRAIGVTIHSDRVPVRAGLVKAGDSTGSFRPGPGGESVVLEARGELLLLPVDEDEEPRNLTRTSGAREKDGVFSPDGKRLAFIADRSGDEELWVADADGANAKQLTSDGTGYRFRPLWSPDGAFILYGDKSLRLLMVDASSGATTEVDRGEYDDAWYRWGIQEWAVSPDSAWIAYSKVEDSLNDSVFLYEVATGRRVRVTGPETRDWTPAFSRDGKYLFFLSDRTFNPIMGRMDQNHIFLDMTRAYLVLLDADDPSPFVGPMGDEVAADEKTDDEDDEVTVTVDVDGITDRVVLVEGIGAGDYDRLEATEDGFLYLSRTDHPFLKYQEVTDTGTETLELWAYSLSDAEAEEVMSCVSNYHLSNDGSQMAYNVSGSYGVVETGTKAELGDGGVNPGKVRLRLDREAEFLQIYNEAWRIQRDWFYDPGMHGLDWDAVGEKYRRFIPNCGNRADLNYLIGEMIGELNAGHTYIYGGEMGHGAERIQVGLLGADLSMPEGAAHFQIRHIVPGNHWHPSERSPLQEPGCSIADGDWLLAINGVEIGDGDNAFAALEDTVGRSVTVTTNSVDSFEGAKECRIRPLASERSLRYRAWVEANRKAVEEASGGRIGYLHIPNMMDSGLVEFARGWYHDFGKVGFIIDERYNGGGFVGDMIIDRLERKMWSFTQPREGKPIPGSERGTRAHLAVLINQDTGSNGEYFAEAIKIKGLAPLIGTRTWGGAVGIEPHQNLVDGGVTTPPQFAPYGLDGRWLIEGHGVDPDIVVENEPVDVLAGRDAQLEKAVEILTAKIAADPRPVPDHPPYPDKSK
jgi:tricorn protease